MTKITGMVVGLILSVIMLLLGIFAYFDTNQIFSNKNDLSLQTAKTISFMPSVGDALKSASPTDELQTLTERISMQTNADYIIIQNRQSEILTHPDPEMIGEEQAFDDGYRAVVFGGYYNIESDEFMGSSIVGKAPIYSEERELVGIVSVGYLKENIFSDIIDRMDSILYFALIVVVIGILLSIFLARHIRKDTMGLEPREIATLYRDRDSVLSSLNEGVIATDAKGRITMINRSAKQLVNLSDTYVNRPIQDALPEVSISETLERSEVTLNNELHINQRVIILNLAPILDQGTVVGAVATFRDKTEIKEMVNTLSEVKKYSEDLRAQTHEFANKMYVISGLLQLKSYDEAFQMVQKEVASMENNNRMIFEQISDPKVQAILLGKMSKASEKKIDFIVDENSYLNQLPEHIEVTHMTTIIGNLIDNAFEEVMSQSERKVTFLTLDIGKDIIFEISDNGGGLDDQHVAHVFQPGYTTKGEKEQRGFGLFNVKETIDELKGDIEINSDENGTTFSIFLPKSDKGGSEDD
ncbi:sensor histidine kinase [Thalassobacillus sp. CUG 92003]|uniref:ATP-binding protein n=1 Tax=Thalassobacillus sp. CUG 92003 TaxID=2736641 RepID=UPI0015E6654D|nr:sensor histidine kinase [Thalassobacillus sp. CUG 92003]